MNDAAFIIGLMRTETDAVGFIPAPAIRERWIPLGRYIIQRDRRGLRRGYILHGPATARRPLYVNQCIIETDHRLRGYATLAVRTLLARAISGQCTEIRLNCAADLSANAFWMTEGFTPIWIQTGGRRRDRQIITYQKKIPAHTHTISQAQPQMLLPNFTRGDEHP